MRFQVLVVFSCFVLVTDLARGNYEVEPNDSMSTASSINIGLPVFGNISSASDVDVFTVDTVDEEVLRIRFRRPSSNYAFNIATIRVTDGQQELASKEIYAPDEITLFDVGVQPNSTYFIELRGCQESHQSSMCAMRRSNQYELLVLGASTPRLESEPNNSMAQANDVLLNSWTIGQHSSKADVDYFRFHVPSAGNITVLLNRPTDNYVYVISRIEILDSHGQILAGDDVYAPSGSALLTLGVRDAQSLYVRATSCSSGSRCDIRFSDNYQVFLNFNRRTTCDQVFRDNFLCSD